jgi:heme exporter protein C
MDSVMLAVLIAALVDVTGIFYGLYKWQVKRLLAEEENV